LHTEKRAAFEAACLALLSLIFLAGCRQKQTQQPDPTQTPAPKPLAITYCDINPSDLCLVGFGLDDEAGMLTLFNTSQPSFHNMDAFIAQLGGDIPLDCKQSQAFPESIYCAGEAIDPGESIALEIYSRGNGILLARGVFIIQLSSLPPPDVKFGLAALSATPTITVLPTKPTSPAFATRTQRSPASYPNPTPAP